MKIRLSSEGFVLDGELEKYASNKLGDLGKELPKRLREHASVSAEFYLNQRGSSKFNTCRLTFTVGEYECKAEETTLHMYAALDIAVVRIEQLLKDFATKQRRGAKRGWQLP